MNIILFGGSFDPPHLAHEKIVQLALKNFHPDKIIIMPSFLNPLKKKFFAQPEQRLAWMKKIFQNYEKVELCDFEIKQNRPTSTWESLQFLKDKYKKAKFSIIIGADNWQNLHKWKNIEELRKEADFIVVSRDEIAVPKEVKKILLNEKISSTYIRTKEDYDKIPPLIREEVRKLYSKFKEKEDKMENILEKKVQAFVKEIDDKKAEDIEVIDMRGKDYISDFVIIATTNTWQARAIIDKLREASRALNEEFLGIEEGDEWTIFDGNDVIVHLMDENHRAKYKIEELMESFKRAQ